MNPRRAAGLVAALAVIGLSREAYFHLVAEDVRALRTGARSDARYAEARALLPPRGVVGYVSDDLCDERPGNPEAHEWGCRLYQQAEYALAPVVLKQGDARRPVVLVNLHDPERLDGVLRAYGLHVVARAGAGVLVAAP